VAIDRLLVQGVESQFHYSAWLVTLVLIAYNESSSDLKLILSTKQIKECKITLTLYGQRMLVVDNLIQICHFENNRYY
jgi:hypothetical protein